MLSVIRPQRQLLRKLEFHLLVTKILSRNLKMHCVYQHNVPRILRQEQCDDYMSISGELISPECNDLNSLQMIKSGIFCMIHKENGSSLCGSCHHHQK